MKKMKVMTILGTRPEIIRLSRVMARLDEGTDHVMVHTGQNFDYELNEIFFADLQIRKPDHFLGAAAGSAARTIGQTLMAVDPVLEKERPEAVLVLGDTNSSLAALAAKRRKIPVFHMEAGNRCFDQRVPEEINRKIVDHISDINLPYSDIAREYLLREGLPPDRVIKTGSPLFEVIDHFRKEIDQSTILETLRLRPDDFFVVSLHREENVDVQENFTNFLEFLEALATEFSRRIIVSVHPRTRKMLEDRGATVHDRVTLLKPLGFFDYLRLQTRAAAVLSDSGTITEEAAILGFPALNLRQTHERPEGMEEAVVPMVGLDWERVRQGLACLEQARVRSVKLPLPRDYAVPNVSEKVLRIILSYTDYVNRTVWSR